MFNPATMPTNQSSSVPMTKRDLALSIADHGRQEEFHQKRGNYAMYDYHKNERLKLEREYRELKAKTMR